VTSNGSDAQEGSLHFISRTWIVADLTVSSLYADAATEPYTLTCPVRISMRISLWNVSSHPLAQPAGCVRVCNYNYFTYLLHRGRSIDNTWSCCWCCNISLVHWHLTQSV